MLPHDQRGLTHSLVLLLVVVAIIGVGVVVYKAWQARNQPAGNQTVEDAASVSTVAGPDVLWNFDGATWQPSASPPACPEPLELSSPVELSRVTGILYPGQYRGGDYKTHGGFRFDNNQAAVTVTAPIDSTLVRASRYLSSDHPGQVQYLLFFNVSCGLWYRIDHVAELGEPLVLLNTTLPQAQPEDSRTTNIQPPIKVKAGAVIATQVGFSGNRFFDFGVYDLRMPNPLSQEPGWASQHQGAKEYDFYGVCWLDVLAPNEAALVRALPAGGHEGKASDYCI